MQYAIDETEATAKLDRLVKIPKGYRSRMNYNRHSS